MSSNQAGSSLTAALAPAASSTKRLSTIHGKSASAGPKDSPGKSKAAAGSAGSTGSVTVKDVVSPGELCGFHVLIPNPLANPSSSTRRQSNIPSKSSTWLTPTSGSLDPELTVKDLDNVESVPIKPVSLGELLELSRSALERRDMASWDRTVADPLVPFTESGDWTSADSVSERSMTTTTSPKKFDGTQSDPDLKKSEETQGVKANGHDALDLAETTEASAKLAADRLEQKRLEHERTRLAQRAKFEEQMKLLEAEQLAEERQLLNGAPVSAPTTPPGRLPQSATTASTAATTETQPPAPIGQGRDLNGAKSMPASRRTSGSAATFGLEKLSLSAIGKEGRREWTEEEDVDAEGAQNSVKYLQMGDDDPFPGLPKKESKHLSASSAALDLAPLSQTPPRAFGQRPFETSIKTSEWPQFHSQQGSLRSMTSPLATQGVMSADPEQLAIGASRKTSPTGMADSIASLPAIPSKSVPGTPFGLGGNGISGARRSGTSPNIGEGLNHNQRGFSNPDLARAFSKVGGGFSMSDGPRPYGADPLYSMGLSPVNTPLPPSAAVASAFTPQSGYDVYGFDDDNFGSGALYPGGPMGLKNKRAETDREFNRFAGMRIEDLQGELLTLCKDQHGCRYLQKKLEEGDPAHRDLIFRETYGHFPELMTDPFGNYLCQKLLEYSSDDQRSAICDSVANDLVGISLNMHGTRAVQKMVDFLAQPRQPKQIRSLIYALSMNVVALIKDLNGNHVIQKCLNKLIPEDNQFIYNAIAANLIEVATHRHGCCVLQRSIDHSSPAQRMQLVTEIIFNSLYLVQDPFGNYVIQYILDLNDARFSEPLIRTFIGNVCSLSVQKFSSNVVEKCIRVADPEIRKVLVGEVLNRSRLEKLLRDSYGNYVIQTILDYCDMGQRMLLIECIRPILPSIRNTPYGKRIQSKLQREDSSFNPYNSSPNNGFASRGGPPNFAGGPGRFHPRHLGRTQLHHVNALTEVYGAHNGGGGHYMPQQREMIPNHTGMSYHAPGPDGQPWLHLRGPTHNGWEDQNPGAGGMGMNLGNNDHDSTLGLPMNWQDPSQTPFMSYPNGSHLPMM
ncbi:pumilio RNA-binding family, partial [Tremellales sp. Uapishka_1]